MSTRATTGMSKPHRGLPNGILCGPLLSASPSTHAFKSSSLINNNIIDDNNE
jgi:hypothetical protein